MARIDFDDLRHTYASTPGGPEDYALRSLDLSFADGGAYALLGPSGCGKTTLLNIISGLVTPSDGRVLFDGLDVTNAPTVARNIAQVFQFPVVYDTMSVRDNIAFPLRNRGVKGAALNSRVDEILEMTGLTEVSNRRARDLSAEYKQKISLGRGLVREDVAAILFDEPLTVIDPKLKWELRSQLKSLHRRSGRTMIYVTHDQTEALTFADHVVVMLGGEVVQVGTPAELFDTPEHTFVGYFIGSPGMNVIKADIEGRHAHIGQSTIDLRGALPASVSGDIELGVRPEHVRFDANGLAASISRVEEMGRMRIVRTQVCGQDIALLLAEGEPIPAHPRISFQQDRLHVYADSRRVSLVGGGA